MFAPVAVDLSGGLSTDVSYWTYQAAMKKSATIGVSCVVLLSGSAIGSEPIFDTATKPMASPGSAASAAPALSIATETTTELRLDPAIFFQKLVDRYRGLNLYNDVVTVVQVTQRVGAEPSRYETKITCEVADGKLNLRTPLSQIRHGFGLDDAVLQGEPAKDAQKKYDLWLAPHMALKFTDQPLKDMRAGVQETFVATGAESVTIDDKKMIHVELRSGCSGGKANAGSAVTDGAGNSSATKPAASFGETCAAKFDLYVNSDSMLIERIEGEQQLPDGASCSTTLQITPGEVEGQAPTAEPAVAPAKPSAEKMQPAI